jgi:hypothetical protein
MTQREAHKMILVELRPTVRSNLGVPKQLVSDNFT